jgi:hypothetical protein
MESLPTNSSSSKTLGSLRTFSDSLGSSSSSGSQTLNSASWKGEPELALLSASPVPGNYKPLPIPPNSGTPIPGNPPPTLPAENHYVLHDVGNAYPPALPGNSYSPPQEFIQASIGNHPIKKPPVLSRFKNIFRSEPKPELKSPPPTSSGLHERGSCISNSNYLLHLAIPLSLGFATDPSTGICKYYETGGNSKIYCSELINLSTSPPVDEILSASSIHRPTEPAPHFVPAWESDLATIPASLENLGKMIVALEQVFSPYLF